MSAILDLYDLDQFVNYMNGFPDLKSPNLDPKHDFLSSIEQRLSVFCRKRQPFSFSSFLVHPIIF